MGAGGDDVDHRGARLGLTHIAGADNREVVLQRGNIGEDPLDAHLRLARGNSQDVATLVELS